MANEISPFAQSAALSLDTIAAGLDNSLMNAPTVESSAGVQFLKLRGDDDWVLGKEKEEILPEDLFVVHPGKFTHGYVAWHGGRPEFKQMIPSNQPLSSIKLPDASTIKAKHGIEDARGMMVAGVDGGFVGVTAGYEANSMGGREAIEGLMRAVRERIGAGEKEICPVISLKTTGYQHGEHGWIVKPVFEIDSWMSLAEAVGATAAADEADKADKAERPITDHVEDAEIIPEPEPKTEGRRRRRAS
jgi:hypothetical protein